VGKQVTVHLHPPALGIKRSRSEGSPASGTQLLDRGDERGELARQISL
jgi:hypothetical protein